LRNIRGIMERYKLRHNQTANTYQNRGMNTYTKLDFILTNFGNNRININRVDWSFVSSDHAACILDLIEPSNTRNFIRAPRISPEWLQNKDLVNDVMQELKDKIRSGTKQLGSSHDS